MYGSAASGGNSSESVDSNTNGGDTPNSRLMPRGTHVGDEELVFRNDSNRSKSTHNHNYMASITTGQKVRNTLSGSTTRVNSHGSLAGSNTNGGSGEHQGGTHRSTSSAGNHPAPSSSKHAAAPRMSARASASTVATTSAPAAAGHQRKPSVDARGYLRALNDIFFGKFCVDELFYREFRERLVSRIQQSTYRYDPADLKDILDDVSEACKSTRYASAPCCFRRWTVFI
ncbi:hypothetical protein H4S06_001968 [Coemansia sp. BCRC 34490]|nr:hypothetical protein H4S06_001968 [Coemansia sp. BCRC 34490]